jgi:predicted TIM-barrel fold metal-dependent hydrolase
MTGRIDVHFHIIPAFYSEAARAAGRLPARGAFPEFTPELALELMDRHRIDVAITSISQPGVHFGDDSKAGDFARRCNDYAAELNARKPRRFGAFATLPLPDVDGALQETARCLDTLKFDGVCLFASYGNGFLGDKAFDPLLAELDRRKAVAFIHPAMHPSLQSIDLPWPGFMYEYPFDTTRAAVNLLFTGALDRFPNVKFILSHAGGVLPFIAWRIGVSPMIGPNLPQLTPGQVFAGLRKFWYDTALSPWAGTMGALREIADPTRILYGSDWPFANEKVQVEADRSLAWTLTAPESAAIEKSNAARLFPRLK